MPRLVTRVTLSKRWQWSSMLPQLPRLLKLWTPAAPVRVIGSEPACSYFGLCGCFRYVLTMGGCQGHS
jgi:hypothetical protein